MEPVVDHVVAVIHLRRMVVVATGDTWIASRAMGEKIVMVRGILAAQRRSVSVWAIIDTAMQRLRD